MIQVMLVEFNVFAFLPQFYEVLVRMSQSYWRNVAFNGSRLGMILCKDKMIRSSECAAFHVLRITE